MKEEEFYILMKKNLENLGEIKITDEQIRKFYKYMILLLEWNEKINLTAIKEPKDIILKHFIDSLTIEKYIEKDKKIIDIGTGAGFPGIPLKIVRPDIDVVLVDSLKKRVNFLENVIEELNLDKIQAIHARAEEVGQSRKYREQFDYTTSRAVASMNVLSEYTIPLLKLNGISIYMKGTNLDEELEMSKKAICTFGGEIKEIEKFSLSKTDNSRTIILVRKIKQTPIKYPRKPGIAKKEPI